MKRILHVPNPVEEDICHTIMEWLALSPDVEQRVFPSCRPRHLARLRTEISHFHPGFVHFHAPATATAAYLLATLPPEVKLIVHWHSDTAGQKNLHRFVKPVETALLRRADVIVASSPRYIEASKPLEPFRAKCVALPRIVDSSKLTPRRTRIDQIRWRYGDKPLLLFAGRRTSGKGLEHLLAAMPLVKHDCRLVVGGAGPSTEHLKGKHASGKVLFMGNIPDDDLAAWYTAADIFLFPLVDRDEAFGPELAEAMWCGTPAVTFTVEGSEVNWVNLNGVTGIEVDNGNVSQLAAAIDHLLSHDEMRHEYGENARRRVVENMTLESVAPALEALYA